MVDLFAIALTHGLLALAAWRLVRRADLDRDSARGDGGVEEEEEARPQRGRPAIKSPRP